MEKKANTHFINAIKLLIFTFIYYLFNIYICDLPLCMSESYVCTVPVEAEEVFRLL